MGVIVGDVFGNFRAVIVDGSLAQDAGYIAVAATLFLVYLFAEFIGNYFWGDPKQTGLAFAFDMVIAFGLWWALSALFGRYTIEYGGTMYYTRDDFYIAVAATMLVVFLRNVVLTKSARSALKLPGSVASLAVACAAVSTYMVEIRFPDTGIGWNRACFLLVGFLGLLFWRRPRVPGGA